MKTLTIVCQSCEWHWEVPKVGDKRRQYMIVNFSICPACLTQVNPVFRKQNEALKLCRSCNLPTSWSYPVGKVKDTCGRCYFLVHRVHRRLAVHA